MAALRNDEWDHLTRAAAAGRDDEKRLPSLLIASEAGTDALTAAGLGTTLAPANLPAQQPGYVRTRCVSSLAPPRGQDC